MKPARMFTIVGTLFALGLAAATTAGAAEPHPFLKLGVVMNGDYGEPLGFADRFVYKGGLDLNLNDLFAIGPEFQYQHLGYDGTVGDVDYSASENTYTFYGNGRFAPKVESKVAPFFGAGIGVVHGTAGGTVGDAEFDGFAGTKGAFHAFGGIVFGTFTADVEVRRVLADGASTDALLNFGIRF